MCLSSGASLGATGDLIKMEGIPTIGRARRHAAGACPKALSPACCVTREPSSDKKVRPGLKMLERQQKNEIWPSGISTFTINSYPVSRTKPSYLLLDASPSVITLKRVARTCAVCLEQIKPGDNARTLKCTHAFHKHCIDDWLKLKGGCPLDRTSML